MDQPFQPRAAAMFPKSEPHRLGGESHIAKDPQKRLAWCGATIPMLAFSFADVLHVENALPLKRKGYHLRPCPKCLAAAKEGAK